MAFIMSMPETFEGLGSDMLSRTSDETPGWKQSLFGGKNLSK